MGVPLPVVDWGRIQPHFNCAPNADNYTQKGEKLYSPDTIGLEK